MLLFITEIYLIYWFVCIIRKITSTPKMLTASAIVVISELIKFLALLTGILSRPHLYFAVIYFMFQLILICLYKINHVSFERCGIGLTILAIIGYYMYYNGDIMGEMTYKISDAGGMVYTGSYQLYRWTTYFAEVIFPSALIFNLFVSPFWKRERVEK